MEFNNVRGLLDRTFSYFIECTEDGDHDTAACYRADHRDFADLFYLINRGFTGKAADILSDMDTHPREEFVMALADDGYDIEKIGFVRI